MPAPRVLIALSEPREARGIAACLEDEGVLVEICSGGGEARARLAGGEAVDALLADPAAGGREVLAEARAAPGAPSVVLIASFGTIEDAVESIRLGAFDYVSRPATQEQVALALRRALEQRALLQENDRLRRTLGERFSLGRMQSRDGRMRRIAQVVEAVADTRAHVLIQGESGTGKTLLARTIHQRSSRTASPFVEVSCGALPAGLLESELFGHVRGAFTGAARDKQGLFEVADGGTLFLDEISAAPPELQVKLLRVLQDKVFERVGDTRTRSVDVRVIAAANRDLEREVAEGRFREDLYYRIHVVVLEVPPLRERPGDVPLLAELFLARYSEEYGRELRGIHPGAMAMLAAAPWPGNVRQLENTVLRAVLLARTDLVLAGDLGAEFHGGPEPSGERPPAAALDGGRTLKEALELPEKRIIQEALAIHGGNRQRTAAMLGVNRTTLFNKMRKYELLDTPRRT